MYKSLLINIFSSLTTFFMRLFIETLDKPNNFSTIFTNSSPEIIVLRFLLKISKNRDFCLINFHKDPSLTNIQ